MQLSLGKVDERGLRCCYHGWTYDIEGRCVHIPAELEEAPQSVLPCVRSYPVVEKQGLVWVYLAETAGEEPSTTPIDFPRFSDAGWHHWVMEREFEGHAFHCVENFLDVPHTNHVHKGLFRSAESKEVRLEITSGRDWIQARFVDEERMESLIGKLLVPKDAEMRHTDRFQLPYVTRVDYAMGEARQYIVMSQCTPVNEHSTRTYTYMAYCFKPFGKLVQLIFEPLSHLILNQDVEVIRQQTESLQRTGEARFLYHPTDAIAAGIRDLLAGKSLEGRSKETRTLRI